LEKSVFVQVFLKINRTKITLCLLINPVVWLHIPVGQLPVHSLHSAFTPRSARFMT